MVFWHFTRLHGWQEFKADESTSFYQRWWAHWASSGPLRICGPILFQLHPHHGKGLFQHQQVASHFKSLDLFYKQSRETNRNCDLIFFFQPFPTCIFGHTLEIKSILFGKFNVILLRRGTAKASREHHYNWNVFKKKKKDSFAWRDAYNKNF